MKVNLPDFEYDIHGQPISLDNDPSIRQSGVTLPLTPAHLKEFAKCIASPTYFIQSYCEIIHPEYGIVDFDLRDYEVGLLKNVHDNRFSCNMLPRQCGKTITISAYILWFTLFNENKLSVIVANKLDYSIEILDRIQKIYKRLPNWLKQGAIKFASKKIEFENGSRILCESTSGRSGVGHAVNILYLDEFAIVPNHIANDFIASVFPVVSASSDSKIIISSTPRGMNHFYDVYNKKKFSSFTIPWNAIPGRDEKWKEDMIQSIGKIRFAQEFECKFLGSSNTLIDGEYLQDLIKEDPIDSKFNDKLRIYERPKPGHMYICCVDPSQGLGNDDSAFVIMDITQFPIKVVAVFNKNDTKIPMLVAMLRDIGMLYNEAIMVVELNGPGLEVVDRMYDELNYDNIFRWDVKTRTKTKQKGVRMTQPLKIQACNRFKDLVESKKIILNDKLLIKQLYTFIQVNQTWKADEGYHDDLVMSCVLGAFFVSLPEYRQYIADPKSFSEHIIEANVLGLHKEMDSLYEIKANTYTPKSGSKRDWLFEDASEKTKNETKFYEINGTITYKKTKDTSWLF